MRHHRFIAPLLPIAFFLIIGIVTGYYLFLQAEILLGLMIVSVILSLLLHRFPYCQTFFIYLTTLLTGCWLIQHPIPDIPMIHAATTRMLSYRTHLVEELQTLPDEASAIISAMSLGDKSMLTKETREVFNITGAGHILALSGLHLGIIYLTISFLIRNYRWRIVSQVTTLLAIWAFAFLVGMTPSVVRAASMLTVYGILSLGYRQKMSVNVLAFTAIVMLIIHPHALFEISFQMSFLAVLAILLFYPPLYGLISEQWLMEHRLIRWLWGMTAVSLTAQIGVAPLIAFYFHRFSTYFLLSNFVVIPCAYLILISTLLFLVTHLSFIATFLSAVTTLMYQALLWIAELPFATIEGLYPSVLQTTLVYFFILLFFYSLIFYYFCSSKSEIIRKWER